MTNIKMLKIYARAFYDFQEVKNEFAGRLRAAEEEIEMPSERKKELHEYEKQLALAETRLLKIMEPYLEAMPIYTEFLILIRGCALRMSACIISSIMDITRFDTVSKLWAYAGLHVKDGKAVKRQQGTKANWNHFLRTKLYVLADCLIKLNSDPETKEPLRYKKFYDDYKTRITNRKACHLTREEHKKTIFPAKKNMESSTHLPLPEAAKERIETIQTLPTLTWLPNGCTKGHVHNMAMRYMEKMFLQDLWLKWWELEKGVPPTKPFAETLLGNVHGTYPKGQLSPASHILNKSHILNENHQRIASQTSNENHQRIASHKQNENQNAVASQIPNENH